MLYEHNNVRNWASILDENTRLQAEKIARSPALCGPLALMPDSHLGIGACVGCVIPTKDAILPAAIGVDIGCGLCAVKTNLSHAQLPLDLSPLIGEFGRSIPSGVGRSHGQGGKRAVEWLEKHPPPHELTQRNAAIALNQMGTLGSGNHFLEVCVDEDTNIWVVVHSGSRGVGNNLARGHIKAAQVYCKAAGLKTEDPDLAYLQKGTDEFEAYIQDMMWAQTYAFENREYMIDEALNQLFRYVEKTTGIIGHEVSRLNTHHNYSQLETHDGLGEVWLSRKGAIQAHEGQLGIVPGSMAAGSFITVGLGNPLSYFSSSHGAGRQMSRGQAKRELTVESLYASMQGCCWNDDNAQALLDEHPKAYKDLDQVMEDQQDLTKAVHYLAAIVNFKGV